MSPAVTLAAALAIAGCATESTDDLVPIAEGRTGGPVDTGTFPNLNVPPQAATAQLTEEEKKAKLARLRAAQQRQSPGGGSVETPEARRKRLQLMSDEQADTLKVIEDN